MDILIEFYKIERLLKTLYDALQIKVSWHFQILISGIILLNHFFYDSSRLPCISSAQCKDSFTGNQLAFAQSFDINDPALDVHRTFGSLKSTNTVFSL